MKRALILLVLFLSAGSIARAETLLFTLSGTTNGSFELDSNPTPDNFQAGVFTGFNNLAFTNGATTVNNYGILFFSTADLGSFSDISSTFFDPGFYGTQIYSGPESAPVFTTGVFLGFDSPNPGANLLERLTISAVAPEPSSLILSFTGLASTGFVAARRKWALRA